MQLAYGNFLFDFNSTKIASKMETVYNAGGQPYSSKQSLEVNGYLSGDTQAEIVLAMSALQAALMTPFQDLVFFQDNGQISATYLRNQGSITGVRITEGPNYPTTEKSEYVNQRYFEFKAEAEYPLPNTGGLLLSFTESLTFEGGGPIYAFRNALNGPPQKQMVWPATPYKVVQRGSAVGYKKYPTWAVPAAKFPFALMKAPKIDEKTPERKGKGFQGYELTWEYEFEDANPLVGTPTLWLN